MKKQFLASSGSLINLFKIVLLFILLEQFVQLSRLVLSNSRTAFLIIFFENLLLEPFLGLLKSKLDSAGAIQSDLLCRDRWDHWMDNCANEGSVTSSLFNQSFCKVYISLRLVKKVDFCTIYCFNSRTFITFLVFLKLRKQCLSHFLKIYVH